MNPKGPSQRQLRVGELIKRVLGELLMRGDLHEEPILTRGNVLISEVRPSPDLRHAQVYVAAHGQVETAEAVAALNRMRHQLKGKVARSVRLKFATDLHFAADGSFDEADRIGQLLAGKS
ncbi:MAG TPA: 30S ribosome-binding factor RbfA [Alphaproteobacteria bacterium]|nr:ribosome-binding factor A [Paracoccaceae bacterium]RCL81615.1 MAG: 30S ribosome-binding factor RbfA [SAR116 cluster bacterium]RPH13397.1 MAG: 30S ribosome-binding factor RbfA [Alphaproteobacteria bacterium TMED150]HBQ23590.1 30S ribosome-binding factor RbfA [Alphaproteobacteria bacterium]HCJ62468.1 30S ribosome-binding factor RbfA [Alphaproteobacteria bacterium]|tara:strand:- start:89 stop:448 length:360 start_codon:yes stop_codon:yes gene_type:complete